MKFTNLEINDVFLLEPVKYSDERGYFMESYNQRTFNKHLGEKIRSVSYTHLTLPTIPGV